jgi:hypothetical protein
MNVNTNGNSINININTNSNGVLPRQPATVTAPVVSPSHTGVSSFGNASGPMTPAKAAQTLLSNFSAVEGVGVDQAGKGAGDGNIGVRELKRIADPKSGMPAEVRTAAKWLLDHPTAARSIDQAAGVGKGDAKEFHFSKADLQAFVAASPSSATGGKPPLSLTGESKPVQVGGQANAPAGEPTFTLGGPGPQQANVPTGEPTFTLGGPGPQKVGDQGIKDVYGAAQQIRDHFQLLEGAGMDKAGKGAGDNNIGMSELKRIADPASGAPAKVRQAAQFLIDHPTSLRSLDQAAGPGKGDAKEVHIGKQDLDSFLANAPKAEAKQGMTLSQLSRITFNG